MTNPNARQPCTPNRDKLIEECTGIEYIRFCGKCKREVEFNPYTGHYYHIKKGRVTGKG